MARAVWSRILRPRAVAKTIPQGRVSTFVFGGAEGCRESGPGKVGVSKPNQGTVKAQWGFRTMHEQHVGELGARSLTEPRASGGAAAQGCGLLVGSPEAPEHGL